MNIQTPLNSALAVRDQFPAIPPGWHYLDSAATAQKPQAVIDAITRAYGHDYATVHRGVYERSAAMTASFEAARAATASLIGGEEHEVVFTRGATEAINLVAQSWGLANLRDGDRILLSAARASFEHRAVAAAAERVGATSTSVPLTADGRIDLDAGRSDADASSISWSPSPMCRTCSARSSTRSARPRSRTRSARSCCSTAARPRRASRSTSLRIGCDFYVFSAHKIYGPTGIGALWARKEILDAMPPWQGGGAMIDRVTFEKTTYLPAPSRFEAGTPHIVGAIGFHAAIDWVEGIGLDALHAHESALVTECARRAAHRARHHPVRAGGQRRDRQLRAGRGSSARHRHHTGRRRRRGPRRPSLRPAVDGLSRRAGDGTGQLCGA